MKTLALFDFDGTLTYEDSASAFYKEIYSNKWKYFFSHYLCCLPQILKLIFDKNAYLPLKKARLTNHLSGFYEEEFKTIVEKFNRTFFSQSLKKSGLEKINWHLGQGHDVWIVSASFDFILKAWCEANNVKLIVNKTKRIGQKIQMDSPECNYNGKVSQIRQHINLHEYGEIYAYGDTSGDLPMLELANHRFYRHFE